MFATAGGPSFPGSPLSWNLFFARQPEPDLEFTEEELEQTANVRSSSPMNSPKKSGGSPLLWILLLIVIGGGAYVAMEPEIVMDLVGPLLGDTPPEPPVATRPVSPKPVPTPPHQPEQAAPAPVAPPAQPPQAAVPAPGMPEASIPAPPAPASQPAPAALAPPTTATPPPLFGEGQRVTVLPNPVAPGQKVSLMKDAAGTNPGPAIPPGTAFTILDGDLQDQGWVYYVRSDYGTKGWLEEKQLRLKR